MSDVFTWFPQMTKTLERMPDSQRGDMLWALVQYGTNGKEPDFSYPLDAIFESLRDHIDNSLKARERGKRGGITNKKGGSEDAEPPLNEVGTTLNESEKGGSEDAEPNTVHNNTVHTNTVQKKERTRFAPPSIEEVKTYCSQKGYTFSPERFWAYYESNGWKVGKNPMKSWTAACVTWAKRDKPPGGEGDEYSKL